MRILALFNVAVLLFIPNIGMADMILSEGPCAKNMVGSITYDERWGENVGPRELCRPHGTPEFRIIRESGKVEEFENYEQLRKRMEELQDSTEA